jgi:N-acetylglucosamine-6-phosphate deacetylase
VTPTLLVAARLVTPTSVCAPGWVEWAGERITGVGSGTPPRTPDVAQPTGTVVPGFVDTHVHGGGGASFGPSHAEAEAVRAAHLARGTTSMVASLVTARIDDLAHSVEALAELVADDLLAGIHLEGPWLSPRHAGAHRRELLRLPSPADVDRLLRAGHGTIRTVTLAPEVDGGLDAVHRVVASGARAAIGHTDAGYAETQGALAAGASLGTHLFNAMRPLHHREPGPALALLERNEAYVELVADGVHLHPAVVRQAAAASARTVLVTDAMAAATFPDGDYRLGDQQVSVTSGRALLRGTDTIAGSTLTMDAAVRYAVTVAGLSLQEAVRAATTTPADLLGRPDLGRLAVGAKADLVVLDDDLAVEAVLRRGRWIRPPRGGPAR